MKIFHGHVWILEDLIMMIFHGDMFGDMKIFVGNIGEMDKNYYFWLKTLKDWNTISGDNLKII